MSKPLTVGALRASLAHLGPNHDDRLVEVWLPGSRIALSATLLPGRAGPLLIEGNVVPGSALDDTATPKEIATFRERCMSEDHR